jgi:hypothetical protein
MLSHGTVQGVSISILSTASGWDRRWMLEVESDRSGSLWNLPLQQTMAEEGTPLAWICIPRQLILWEHRDPPSPLNGMAFDGRR